MQRSDDRPRVLVRVITSPQIARGERLAIYVDTRTLDSTQVLVYSLTYDTWRSEAHRPLMWRTRRATQIEQAEAQETLQQIGERVRIVQSTTGAKGRAVEMPADRDDDRAEPE